MAIQTSTVGLTVSTVTYTSTNETAITFMSLCNFSGVPVTVDIHIVPSGGISNNANKIISSLEIASDDTYIMYEGNEKLVLGNSDGVVVVAPGAIADPIAVTAISANGEYQIVTLGSTNYIAIGATQITTTNFVPGTVYIIDAVGDTDFTLIGAGSNSVGEVFTATGIGDGTTGTALEAVFTASAAGTGTGTVRAALVTVVTSYIEV